MSSAGLTRRAAYGALLRREGYVPFTLTVALARLAVPMFTTAGVLLVLERTGSPALAGVTAAAAVLPGALTGPLLGAWLEVARRRRLLIVVDQLLSVVGLVAILLLAGHAPNWTLPVAAVVYSFTRPLSGGSFASALSEIAGPELIEIASTIEASSLNLAFIVGPALAGTLSAVASPAIAIEVQVALTLLVAGLVAVNPVFESRSADRAAGTLAALREGLSALARDRVLRNVGLAGILASGSWSLMIVGFPLYAVQTLHSPAHTSGYMWAAMATGSLLGTFVLHGAAIPRRIAFSYAALGVSALAWPLVHVLALGILLVGITGFLEGPAFSGSVAVRQRDAPARVRGQVIMTLTSGNLIAGALCTAIGGAVGRPVPLILGFVGINLAAAVVAGRG
jgi:MFS family permease